MPGDLMGDPFAHLVARGAVAEATSAAAWLQAMLDVEAALAAAQADSGDIPSEAAEAIIAACHIEHLDADALAAATEQGGVPVIGLVEQVRARVGRSSRRVRPPRGDQPGHPRHRGDGRRPARRGADRRPDR